MGRTKGNRSKVVYYIGIQSALYLYRHSNICRKKSHTYKYWEETHIKMDGVESYDSKLKQNLFCFVFDLLVHVLA